MIDKLALSFVLLCQLGVLYFIHQATTNQAEANRIVVQSATFCVQAVKQLSVKR